MTDPPVSRALKRWVRLRMAETGEKYTTALRAIQADALLTRADQSRDAVLAVSKLRAWAFSGRAPGRRAPGCMPRECSTTLRQATFAASLTVPSSLDLLMRRRQRYPSTDRDGLDARHVLSAWETSRSAH